MRLAHKDKQEFRFKCLPRDTSKQLEAREKRKFMTMTSLSHIIPIDGNGFFCIGHKPLETSTGDSDFDLQYESFRKIENPNTIFDGMKNIALVTPEKKTEDSIDDSKTQVKRWFRGRLKAEPCDFVTQAGLLYALKHKAPAVVIQFMLKINPNVMNFPDKGPTPLQVAVHNNADLDIVKMLLDASPFGECILNPGFPESPLEYARRHLSHRTDLIKLLSRERESRDQSESEIRDRNSTKKQRDGASFIKDFNLFPRYSTTSFQTPTKQTAPLLSPPPSFLTRQARANSIISDSTASHPTSVTPPTTTPKKSISFTPQKDGSPVCKKKILSEVKLASNQNKLQQREPASSRSPAKLPEKKNQRIKGYIDREELNNVKTLCALLWKAQRKMAKQVNASKDEIGKHSELLATMGTKDEILEELMKQQRSQMFRNWIALDIKERAYQNRLEEMEKRHEELLKKHLHRWTGSMRVWNESIREQLEELRAFVDSEAETNEYFRNNMTDFIEQFTEDQENNTNVPSQVFATNMGEVNQRVPLCAGIRGAFCGYGTDTTEGDTDPIIGIDDDDKEIEIESDLHLIRNKKRSWRPLFKNRDYSAVE